MSGVSDRGAGGPDAEGIPVAFKTLGCKVNRVESEDIAANLLGRGCRISTDAEAAVVVVNTCTVTGEADAKARKAVRRALASPRSPVVVVTGCLAAIDPGSLLALSDRVIVEPDKERVAARVATLLGVDESPHSHVPRVGAGFRTRALLKIEDGCDNFCAYCIVPYARGVPRSVPLESVESEARTLVASGTSEIVLTGINVGRYRDGEADLADVIRAVARTGIRRLRLSSIEPPDVNDRLLAAVADTPAFCAHLHIPLQSGSDRVLKAMGRGYTSDDYARIVARAREAVPGLAVTTDVMAGYPTETWADAVDSLAFCMRMEFARMHVFRYSQRPGTPAAGLAQVPADERGVRAEALRMYAEECRHAHMSSLEGTVAEMLVEQLDGDAVIGTTEDYVRVRARTEACIAVGDSISVRLGQRDGDVVCGVHVGGAW